MTWDIIARRKGNSSQRGPSKTKLCFFLPLHLSRVFESFLKLNNLSILKENEDIITILKKLEESEKQSSDIFDMDNSSKLNSSSDEPDEVFMQEAAENDMEEEICDIAFTKFISREVKTLEEFNLQKYRILHSHV